MPTMCMRVSTSRPLRVLSLRLSLKLIMVHPHHSRMIAVMVTVTCPLSGPHHTVPVTSCLAGHTPTQWVQFPVIHRFGGLRPPLSHHQWTSSVLHVPLYSTSERIQVPVPTHTPSGPSQHNCGWCRLGSPLILRACQQWYHVMVRILSRLLPCPAACNHCLVPVHSVVVLQWPHLSHWQCPIALDSLLHPQRQLRRFWSPHPVHVDGLASRGHPHAMSRGVRR